MKVSAASALAFVCGQGGGPPLRAAPYRAAPTGQLIPGGPNGAGDAGGHVRKALSLLAAGLIVMTTAVAARQDDGIARAQGAPDVSCDGQSLTTPMQGHYTGTWHSDGDYHFYVFQTDLELKIILDGTFDVTVSPQGQVSGTAKGSVNAPIFDYGKQDISSGIGTISGTISGQFSGGGSLLVMPDPVIDMHWGTFGGHAIERFITMPNYRLDLVAMDCVSAQGTISETNFPVQNVVADGTPNTAIVPGIGSATGTWQIASDATSRFEDLSSQVDGFIGQATVFLSGQSGIVTPAGMQQNVVAPLRDLEAKIRQQPDVARCLLDRLGHWEASALTGLLQQAQSIAGADLLSTLRRSSDILRSSHLLNIDCGEDESVAAKTVTGAQQSALDSAISSRAWSTAILVIREIGLLQGSSGFAPPQQQVNADLHALVLSGSGAPVLLETARMAYALGDNVDASAAISRLRSFSKKQAKQDLSASRSSKPKTLRQMLASGVAHMSARSSGGTSPTFFWQTVPGASQYLVVVVAPTSPLIVWSWAGTATNVPYGDTTLPNVAGSSNDGWTVPLPAGSHWSVLALDASGHILGLKLRK